jgi:hypothetical protein
VANDTTLWIVIAHVGYQTLVGTLFVRRVSITAMAALAAQLAMGRGQRFGGDEVGFHFAARGTANLEGTQREMAIMAAF